MRRRNWPILLALLLIMLAGVIGCGKRAAQNPIPGKKLPQAPSAASQFVSFTEQDLGVTVYPGATQAEGQKQEEGNTFCIAARFTTPDEYANVLTFYREKYPGAMPTETDGSLTLSLLDAKYTTIRIVNGDPVGIVIEQQIPN